VKNDLCYRCKKNKAGKYRLISFVHLGLTVKIFKDGTICADCAKEEWIKDFEENAKEFVSAADGRPKVDWQRYHEYFAMGRFHNQKERFHSLLIGLGVLSHDAKGNWEIVADGPIGLNPRAHLAYLYFTQKEDAVEFARLEKARTLYHWEIHHVDEVIPKQEVLS
jgi:hypothetical protein